MGSFISSSSIVQAALSLSPGIVGYVLVDGVLTMIEKGHQWFPTTPCFVTDSAIYSVA